MKTPEEIQKLSYDYSDKVIIKHITDAVTYGYNNGYNQCQEDMADEIVNFHEWIRHQKPSELKYVGNVNGKCYDYKREYYTTKELYSIYQSLKNEKL